MIDILDKDKLYKATGWFSVDCERFVNDLEKCGLVVVNKEAVEKHNQFCNMLEDDLK